MNTDGGHVQAVLHHGRRIESITFYAKLMHISLGGLYRFRGHKSSEGKSTSRGEFWLLGERGRELASEGAFSQSPRSLETTKAVLQTQSSLSTGSLHVGRATHADSFLLLWSEAFLHHQDHCRTYGPTLNILKESPLPVRESPHHSRALAAGGRGLLRTGI